MSFENNSFLGKQIEVIRNNHISSQKGIIELANNMNKDLNEILYNLRHTDDNRLDYLLIGLFCRIIQSYNSIIKLSNYGLSSDAKVILRSMMEAAFNLGALVYDKSYYENYVAKGSLQTKFLISNIKKESDYFTKEIIDSIDDRAVDEINEFLKGKKRISTEDLSKKSKMHYIYLYTYNILSLQTHANIKSLMGDFIEYEEDNFKSIRMKPDFDDYKFIINTSMVVLLDVIRALEEHFDEIVIDFVGKYSEKITNNFNCT